MAVPSETLRSISTPERLESRLGTLEFVDGRQPGLPDTGSDRERQRLDDHHDKSWQPSEIEVLT